MFSAGIFHSSGFGVDRGIIVDRNQTVTISIPVDSVLTPRNFSIYLSNPHLVNAGRFPVTKRLIIPAAMIVELGVGGYSGHSGNR